MTLEKTKLALLLGLEDPQTNVVALTGLWGTGKSYLWNTVRADAPGERIRNAIYVSLFGARSIDQLKMRILQVAVADKADFHLLKRAVGTIGPLVSRLTAFHKGFGAIEDLALMGLPAILKDRLLVIDDIERGNENLTIDEFFGFVDECVQRSGTRFLMILNLDQLEGKPIWEKLREKVIDQEIGLILEPGEAFALAAKAVSANYPDEIRDAVEVCGIRNIRVIQRIIRTV